MVVAYLLVLQIILVLTQNLGRYYLKSSRYLLLFNHFIVEFFTHPDNITVFDGTEVEFSCVAVTEFIIYTVNDTLASKPSIIDQGFTLVEIEDINPTARRRNLTATALAKYNNTKIQCVATDFVNPALNSDTGTLLVQGKLLLIKTQY